MPPPKHKLRGGADRRRRAQTSYGRAPRLAFALCADVCDHMATPVAGRGAGPAFTQGAAELDPQTEKEGGVARVKIIAEKRKETNNQNIIQNDRGRVHAGPGPARSGTRLDSLAASGIPRFGGRAFRQTAASRRASPGTPRPRGPSRTPSGRAEQEGEARERRRCARTGRAGAAHLVAHRDRLLVLLHHLVDGVLAARRPLGADEVALAAEDVDGVAVGRGDEAEAVRLDLAARVPHVLRGVVGLDVLQRHGVAVAVLRLAADHVEHVVQDGDRLVAAGHGHRALHGPAAVHLGQVDHLHVLHRRVPVGVVEAAHDGDLPARHGGEGVAAALHHGGSGDERVVLRVEDHHPVAGLVVRGGVAAHDEDHLLALEAGAHGHEVRRRVGHRAHAGPLLCRGVEGVDLRPEVVLDVDATEEVDLGTHRSRRVTVAGHGRRLQRREGVRGRRVPGVLLGGGAAEIHLRVRVPLLVAAAAADEVDGVADRGRRHVAAVTGHVRLPIPDVVVDLALDGELRGRQGELGGQQQADACARHGRRDAMRGKGRRRGWRLR
mmetsp:Transcript_27291/g.81298  ORF Transcript_27291/g.81298 Transcript_27291/m.81298 type:complete len:550 (-) Transcript_27291:26-1675(-)